MSEVIYCVIYTRISKDKERDKLGVARQEALCRKLAEAAGWVVVGVFSDNNLSAFKRGKRPQYDAMLDVIRSGGATAIVTYNPDRLTRNPRDLEDLIDLLERHSVLVSTVQSGLYDLATPGGRMAARMAGAVARHESELNKARVKDKHAELRGEGRPNGGPRPYGYRRTGAKTAAGDTRTYVPDEVEAPRVTEMIHRSAAGETLTAIAEDFNDRGWLTRADKPWTLTTVRRVVLNGGYAGRRMHNETQRDGSVTLKDVGPAGWPAIVDEGVWRRAVAILTDASRPRRGSSRRYLLGGGLLVCGACGSILRSHPAHKANGTVVPRYACTGAKCSVGGRADAIEQLVADTVIEAVESPAFAKALRRRSGAGRDNAGAAKLIEAEIADLEAEAEAGRVPVKMYTRLNEALTARLVAAQAASGADTSTAALGRYAGRKGALRHDWEAAPEDGGLSFDDRQTILRAALDRVTLAPAGRGAGPRFDVHRVAVDLAGAGRSKAT